MSSQLSMLKQPFKRDNWCGAVYELFGEGPL
jgi:hypothetical protein